MLTLMWNISAAIRGYMRFYMPSNIAIDLLRTPCGPSGPCPWRWWQCRPACTP